MSKTIGKNPDGIEKMLFGFVILALLILGMALSQPIWNAPHLINQFNSDCKKQGGIEIVDKGMFGNTYSCNPWLGKT
jgi:hypothetical protein